MRRVKTALVIATVLIVIALFSGVLLSKRSVVYGGIAPLSDTALSNEAHFIRHRSMTDLYEVFGVGPGLLPYFASDFVYAPPPYLDAHEEIR